MNAEAILKELVEIRLARRTKFVPYDLERRLKKREAHAWELAEKWARGGGETVDKAPEPPKLAKQPKAKAAKDEAAA